MSVQKHIPLFFGNSLLVMALAPRNVSIPDSSLSVPRPP